MATRNCHSAVDAAAASGETMLADIADRNSAEDAIRESEERFRLVANTAPVLIWMSDVDKLCTYFNEPWLEFTGEPLESQLGNGWTDGVHPEDLERCLGIYTEAFDRRERFRMEYRLPELRPRGVPPVACATSCITTDFIFEFLNLKFCFVQFLDLVG